jgi:hypothetical protein
MSDPIAPIGTQSSKPNASIGPTSDVCPAPPPAAPPPTAPAQSGSDSSPSAGSLGQAAHGSSQLAGLSVHQVSSQQLPDFPVLMQTEYAAAAR